MKIKKKSNKAKMKRPSSSKKKDLKLETDALGSLWINRYAELLEYREKHGDCLVPTFYATNKALGSWVFRQRQEYKKLMEGKKSLMSEARANALEKIGFVWSTQISWEERLDELRAYKDQNGDCNVSQHDAENPSLGKWVNKCREEYKRMNEGKKSYLTESRVRDLEALGFVWHARTHFRTWEQRYEELQDYIRKHGDCNISQNYGPEHPYRSLGVWIKNQRYQAKRLREGKKSTMTQERIRLLEDLNFVWEPRLVLKD
eukprot:CAMPEP_0196809950 /NCGR_PEP_ID=MMETSP1362-20130617/9825_1 /TAXON_ID=163516 /ORGANISM="Leptocylindrus danicus, Strain CCMP1856" /LENGTH=258 /DNA_ID=CAMNT_0042184801 /DNA_START=13 /DNA_END=789 /DNA_ORIENTATION=+